MEVRVANHQVDTGESLREHAQQKIAEITEKYFARSIGANVTFERGPNNDYKCNIIAPVAQGIVLKATYDGREPEIAFNGAADRIEKQLRRYTRRLKDHKVDEDDQAYVENAGYTIFSASAEGEESEPAGPTIVAETRTDIPEFERVGCGDADGPAQHDGAHVPQQRHRRVQHDLPPRRREHRLGRAAYRLTIVIQAARCDRSHQLRVETPCS